MTDEADNKAGKLKKWAALVFGLLLMGCGAALSPPTYLAVLIALTAPTPTMTSEFEPAKKAAKKKTTK
jgi:hypothetical protein